MTLRLLICFLFAALPAIAQETSSWPDKTFRRHTAVRDAEKELLFLVTEIVHVDSKLSDHTVLIEDETRHERFIYHSRFNSEKKRVLSEISDDSGKLFIRRTYEFDVPASSNTIPGILDEARLNPKILELSAPMLTFEAPSFNAKVSEKELQQPKSRRAFVAQLRETLDPHFLESLELMRSGGLRASSLAAVFFDNLGSAIFHTDCPPPENAHEAEEPPDCGFDKSFGFPCSDEQLEKIATAQRDGKTLTSY